MLDWGARRARWQPWREYLQQVDVRDELTGENDQVACERKKNCFSNEENLSFGTVTDSSTDSTGRPLMGCQPKVLVFEIDQAPALIAMLARYQSMLSSARSTHVSTVQR